jgi:hypothetical protein
MTPRAFSHMNKSTVFILLLVLGVFSVPRKLVFRALPAVPGYRSKASEMRGALHREHQLDAVLQLKRATAPKLLPHPACREDFHSASRTSGIISSKCPMQTRLELTFACFKEHESMLDHDGPSLSIDDAVKGTGWETSLDTLADGRSSRVRPKTQCEHDKQVAEGSQGQSRKV